MLRTIGFVLYKKDVAELDREYCLFTKKYGKIKLIAKSVRKILSKLSSQLEPPALISVVFIPTETKGMITTALAVSSNAKIRKDIERFKVYKEIMTLLNNFTMFNQKDPELWKLLKTAISDLRSLDAGLVEISYATKFIELLGFRPNLRRCLDCNKLIEKTSENWFDLKRAGIVCSDCNKSKSLIKLSKQTIKSLQVLHTTSIKKIVLSELDEPIMNQYKNIKTFLKIYISYIHKSYF